ncbi:MAG: CoA-binding protein [Myxococcota bacterium]
MARVLTTTEEIRAVLERSRVVAVLGAHSDPGRPAFYVPDYLHGVGARILPVNPALVGQTLWGEPVRATLSELGVPVDVVDVFRRSEALAGHLDDLLGMNPAPAVVWMQQGIRDDVVAARLVAAGIDVVQDRCMLADHRRMGLGRITAGAIP